MILDIVFEQLTTVLPAVFEEENLFDVDFGSIVEIPPEDLPAFEGSYAVIPTFADQTLETSGLLMRADMIVNQIPIARVSNNSGGKTVIIGG